MSRLWTYADSAVFTAVSINPFRPPIAGQKGLYLYLFCIVERQISLWKEFLCGEHVHDYIDLLILFVNHGSDLCGYAVIHQHVAESDAEPVSSRPLVGHLCYIVQEISS